MITFACKTRVCGQSGADKYERKVALLSLGCSLPGLIVSLKQA